MKLLTDDLGLAELAVRAIQLPGKLLVWPVSMVVRIPPRHLLAIELTIGLAVWVGVSLLVAVL